MKRTLLSLWLGGAAIYTINTLILTGGLSPISEGPRQQSPQISEAKTLTALSANATSPTVADFSQDEARQPRHDDFKPYGNGASPTVAAANLPKPRSQDVIVQPSQDHFERYGDATPDDRIEDPIGWVRVTRSARLHTDPDVSSPTVRFYPPDTDLQLVSQQNGWMKVADPGTGATGWIFQVYLSSSEAPSTDAHDAQSSSAGVEEADAAKALVLSDEPTPLVSKRKASKRWSPAKEKRRYSRSARRHKGFARMYVLRRHF